MYTRRKTNANKTVPAVKEYTNVGDLSEYQYVTYDEDESLKVDGNLEYMQVIEEDDEEMYYEIDSKGQLIQQVLNSDPVKVEIVQNELVSPSKDPNAFSCELCGCDIQGQINFFAHLKAHYEPSMKTGEAEKVEDEFETITGDYDDIQEEVHEEITEEENEETVESFGLEEDSIELYEDDNDKPIEQIEEFDDTYIQDEDMIIEEIEEGECVNPLLLEEFKEETIIVPTGGKYVVSKVLLPNRKIAQDESKDKDDAEKRKRKRKSNSFDHIPKDFFTITSTADKLDDNLDIDPIKPKYKRQYACNHCQKVLNTRSAAVYHYNSYIDLRQFTCELCGKTFLSRTALDVHRRRHGTARPFVCQVCGKAFKDPSDLQYHMSAHSDVRRFKCETCGKAFARNYSLTIHTRCHTGERPYKCQYCNKGFRASNYLRSHIRLHTGEKPHECPICQHRFRVRSDFKRHYATHERNGRTSKRKSKAAKTEISTIVIRDPTLDSSE